VPDHMHVALLARTSSATDPQPIRNRSEHLIKRAAGVERCAMMREVPGAVLSAHAEAYLRSGLYKVASADLTSVYLPPTRI
jgi:hypothetical protein